MIGKDEIAEACRNLDALAEEHEDFPGFWTHRGVDLEGLIYVAHQRALRTAMMMDGQNPNPAAEYVRVRLPDHLQHLLPNLAALFIDGFAAGLTLERED